MIREQRAIKVLLNVQSQFQASLDEVDVDKDCKEAEEDNTEIVNALDIAIMAIKALEQEPFMNKACVAHQVCHEDKVKMLDKIKDEILEEKECAYADFERYKVEYLGQDWENALDSLPQDDFRYGMERCIEIIDKYKA